MPKGRAKKRILYNRRYVVTIVSVPQYFSFPLQIRECHNATWWQASHVSTRPWKERFGFWQPFPTAYPILQDEPNHIRIVHTEIPVLRNMHLVFRSYLILPITHHIQRQPLLTSSFSSQERKPREVKSLTRLGSPLYARHRSCRTTCIILGSGV